MILLAGLLVVSLSLSHTHTPSLSSPQALGVVLAASTIAVFGGIAIGGFAGTFLVYVFLLIPILCK